MGDSIKTGPDVTAKDFEFLTKDYSMTPKQRKSSVEIAMMSVHITQEKHKEEKIHSGKSANDRKEWNKWFEWNKWSENNYGRFN